MSRARSAADIIRAAMVALWFAVALALVAPPAAHPQVSTGLGGDASGPPSNVRIKRLGGLTVPLSITIGWGSPLVWDGTQITGGTVAVTQTSCDDLITWGVTSTQAIGTTRVTLTSITVPANRFTEPWYLDESLTLTATVTASTVLTFRRFVNGRTTSGSTNLTAGVGTSVGSANIPLGWRTNSVGGWAQMLVVGSTTQANYWINADPTTKGMTLGHVVPLSPLPLVELTAEAANNNPGNVFVMFAHFLQYRR